ncbi:MAG: type IV secretory system conjugative DNA transfer family protein [Alphaproteobacteria bacterium]|nr:type IV secretory system conjugative DNA transfer family protein [Alphaproteobacteria bacterium]
MTKRRGKLPEQIAAGLGESVRGLPDTFHRHQPLRAPRFARFQDVYDSVALEYRWDDPGGQFLVGGIGDKPVGIEDNRHIVMVAGSRAGKSVTITNNLLHTRAPVLCLDPKGELASLTALRRRERGQRVHILDPYGIVAGPAAAFRARFNPMAGLTPDNPFIIEDAAQVADSLIVSTGAEKDPHWNESAGEGLTGKILHVATDPRFEGRRTLVTVRELINDALAPLPGADDDDNDDGPQFALEAEMLDNAARLHADGQADLAAAIEGAAHGFYDRPPNERGGVLSTMRRHTKFLDFPSIRDTLSGHDFDLADLKRDPNGVSVYICLPATRMGTCSGFLRIMVSQLLDAMERERAVPKAPVLVILDEFPVLGHMRQLQDAAGQIASFHVRLVVIIQDITQIKALYAERWESFLANAGLWLFFGNTDLSTLEYMSRKLGKIAVETTDGMARSTDEAMMPARGRQFATEDLMAPEECARIFARNDPHKRMLALWADAAPMILQRIEYFDENGPFWPRFRGTFTPLR